MIKSTRTRSTTKLLKNHALRGNSTRHSCHRRLPAKTKLWKIRLSKGINYS